MEVKINYKEQPKILQITGQLSSPSSNNKIDLKDTSIVAFFPE